MRKASYVIGRSQMRERLFSVLDAYVARQLLLHFALTAAAIGGLMALFDTLELLRRTSDNVQIGFFGVIGLALLKLPHGLQATFPFAIMLGTMHLLFRLSRSNQLLVMMCAGRSVWQMLALPGLIALALGIGNLVVFDPFAAHLYQDYQRLEDLLVRRLEHPFELSKAGIWAQEKHGAETTILFSPTVHEDGEALVFGHLTVFKNAGNKPLERIEANGARLQDGALALTDVWQFGLGTGTPAPRHVDNFTLPTTLTAERLQDSFEAPETMSVGELQDFIAGSQNAGFATARHRLYLQAQIASPLL